MTYIDAEGRQLGPAWGGGPPDTLAYSCPVGACFLYRRDVYETVGDYSEELFLVEDWDYWIRIAQQFKIRALPNDLYLYRLHGESLSWTNKEKHKRVSRQMLERHLPQMDWVSGTSKAHGYLYAARIAWSFGEPRNALRHIRRALALSPGYTLTRLAGEPFDRLRRKGNALASEEASRG
jgi:hypothetical protein